MRFSIFLFIFAMSSRSPLWIWSRHGHISRNVEPAFYLRLLESRKFYIPLQGKARSAFMLYAQYSVGFGIAYPQREGDARA